MKKSDLNLTPEQLAVYTALQKVRQAWTTLILILLLFAVGFFAFLYAVFTVPEQALSKSIVGGIDFLLGWAIKAIVNHLFPPPK
jgi:hypothetical protein